jgi:hypothetical protein
LGELRKKRKVTIDVAAMFLLPFFLTQPTSSIFEGVWLWAPYHRAECRLLGFVGDVSHPNRWLHLPSRPLFVSENLGVTGPLLRYRSLTYLPFEHLHLLPHLEEMEEGMARAAAKCHGTALAYLAEMEQGRVASKVVQTE